MRFRKKIIRVKLSTIICWCTLAILVCIVLLYAPFADFVGYWSAGRIFLRGGDPYAHNELEEIQRSLGMPPPTLDFWNPPWAFCLFLPFSLLDYLNARIAWVCIEAILLLIVVHWLWNAFGGHKSDWLIGFVAMILFVPTIQTLLFAQITPFVLFGLIGFVWAVEHKKDYLAGLFTVFIAAKPHVAYAFWVVAICYCCRYRKIRLLTCMAAFLITSALFLFLYNPNIIWGISRVLSKRHQFQWITATLGISLRYAFGINHLWLQLLPTVVGTLYLVFFWNKGGAFSWRKQLSPILLLSSTTAIYLWPHDCVILLPAIIQILVWFRIKARAHWWLLALLVVANILLPLAPPWRFVVLAWWFPAAIALIYWVGLRSECHLQTQIPKTRNPLFHTRLNTVQPESKK